MVKLGPANSELPQISLKVEKIININNIDIPVLTDGTVRYFAVLDLSDVTESYYPRELHYIFTDDDLGKNMAVGRIDMEDETLREVYVIPAKDAPFWFFKFDTGSVRRHKIAMKCLDDIYYAFRRLNK